MNTLLRLSFAILLTLGSCVGPGPYTDLTGSVSGHVRVSSTWLVALGMAKADISTALPQGIVLKYPLQVREGFWLTLDFATGKTKEGALTEALPAAAAALYAEGEWESLLLREKTEIQTRLDMAEEKP